jgi:hypothetical protein
MCHDVFLWRLDSKKSWPKPKHVITCHNKHIDPDPKDTKPGVSPCHPRKAHYNSLEPVQGAQTLKCFLILCGIYWGNVDFCFWSHSKSEALTRNEVHRGIVWGWKSPMTRWCISRTINILAAWSTIFTHVPDGGILDVCRLVLAFHFSGLNSPSSDSESPETGANFIY